MKAFPFFRNPGLSASRVLSSEAIQSVAEVEGLVGGARVAEVRRERDAGRVKALVKEVVGGGREGQLGKRSGIVLMYLRTSSEHLKF